MEENHEHSRFIYNSYYYDGHRLDPSDLDLKAYIDERIAANPSPGGSSYLVWDAAYQNSAMSAPVGAYLFKDASAVIWKVYEPVRGNTIQRSQFSYEDTIDKFPFDNVNCFGNNWSDNKPIDFANDVKIQNCNPLQNMVINGGGYSGLELKKVVGFGGYFLPDFEDIIVGGNNCIYDNLIFYGGGIFNLAADSIIQGVQMGYGSAIDANGFKTDMKYCRLEEQADVWVVSNNGGNATTFQNCSFKQLSYSEGAAQGWEYVTVDPNANVTAGQTDNDNITEVNTGTKTFSVAGDQTARYIAGKPTRVGASTGNNGYYTISSSSYNGGTDRTLIVMLEDIPSAVSDGNIRVLILANSVKNSHFEPSCSFKQSAENLDFDGLHVSENLSVNTGAGYNGVNILNVGGTAYILGEDTGAATLTPV